MKKKIKKSKAGMIDNEIEKEGERYREETKVRLQEREGQMET